MTGEAGFTIANDLKQQAAEDEDENEDEDDGADDGTNSNGERKIAKSGEAKLSDLAIARGFVIDRVLNQRLVPLLTSRFGTTTTDENTNDTDTI